MDKNFNSIKKIGFAAIIFLIYVSLVFLISKTFTIEAFGHDCKYNVEDNSENYENCREKYDTISFIILNLISLFSILFLMFYEKEIIEFISYSIYFGAGFSTFVSLVSAHNVNSLLASFIGIVFFVLFVYLANKKMSEIKVNKK